MKTIHQLVAGFRGGDAISNASLMMRAVFRSWGCRSDILALKRNIAVDSLDEARDVESAIDELGRDDIAVLHLSIGSKVNELFRGAACKKVIVYHNITPSHYFRYLCPQIEEDLELGRRHLEMLAGVADINLADSAFNAAELTAAGYRDAKVLPLPLNIDSFAKGGIDAATLRDFSDGARNVLFVGRCAPNKRLEDFLSVTYYLTKIAPNIRIVRVGSQAGAEIYYSVIKARAKALGLTNFIDLGSVPQPVLNACYASASAFLCVSEHEGFCAPLIEAMLHHVPVFALAASAVPETLAGAGVLFNPPLDHLLAAETMAEVLGNDTLRNAIVARQDARIESFRNRDLDGEMRALFAPVMH